ncbi:MAG: UvrD-helicase domain-containing protein [Deltaproteobacteria bacterium]|jgi:DNA helicase-2/ATP-dependent DNA helicase PcrA|nr:UvrD-helicase domain-containing protein [Deltaproteobacteria bacterium]
MEENQQPQHLQNLNKDQYEAVTYLDGPLIIFAGAGSGKTRVLTRRIAHLIYTKKAYPSQILAVTFTNKAAKEMKERVACLFSNNLGSFWVSTFHATCLRILRVNAEHLGFNKNFVVYDANDSLAIIKKILKELNLEKNFLTPKEVQNQIDRVKNDFLSDEEFVRFNSFSFYRKQAEQVLEIYQLYQAKLKKSNALDFGDLICKTIELFRDHLDILEHYQNQFKYIMVDEYQDTNHAQYLLIKMLAAKNKNLCVVGDDDQSIYAFRGANIGNILNFKNNYPDCKEITLNINYRSTKKILSVAANVIEENKNRKKKNITTINDEGELISYYCGDTDKNEANFVAREILRLQQQGVKPVNIAIFYRTNFQSRVIEEALLSNNINYTIYGGLKFYERKEIKDILSYCRLLINPNDDSALLRIINTPIRGIGNSTIVALQLFASSNNIPLWTAIEKIVLEKKLPNFSARVLKKLEVFYKIILNLKKLAHKIEMELQDKTVSAKQRGFLLSSLIKSIVTDTGYLQELGENKSEESVSRKENIFELMRVCEDFIANNAEDFSITISNFLDQTSLASDLDNANLEADFNNLQKNNKKSPVSLMTLHLAKGLEFDVVFLIGMEEGLLPHLKSLDTEEDLEEERRLCYVGITRTKKKLYLSQALIRRSFNSSSPYASSETSRFLMNIPQELIQYEKRQFIS